MSKLLFLVAGLLFWSTTSISWLDEPQYDFGWMAQGKPQTHLFHFKNTSTDSIRVETIRTTCGCTAPTWSEVPIPPDSTGVIAIEYDAQRTGYFKKKIKVFFDKQRKAEILLIEGFVE
ncbi:MAG: DUF1573 domain-containing protein [Bacteroidota bacterium]